MLDLAETKFHLSILAGDRVATRLHHHVDRHVEADHFANGSDLACREEAIETCATAKVEDSTFRDGSDVFLGISEESGGIPRAPNVTATARDGRAVLEAAIPRHLAPLAGDRAVAFAHRSSAVLKIGKGFFEHRILRTLTVLFASLVAVARTTVARQMVEATTVARPVVEHATTGKNFKLTAF